jgi:hypothetical protein
MPITSRLQGSEENGAGRGRPSHAWERVVTTVICSALSKRLRKANADRLDGLRQLFAR